MIHVGSDGKSHVYAFNRYHEYIISLNKIERSESEVLWKDFPPLDNTEFILISTVENLWTRSVTYEIKLYTSLKSYYISQINWFQEM